MHLFVHCSAARRVLLSLFFFCTRYNYIPFFPLCISIYFIFLVFGQFYLIFIFSRGL